MDEGGGVFYAPKIDTKLWDALGREWQGPTCQVDLNLPERFDLTFAGQDGREHRAIMIHRTVLGSMERFIGGLIAHYGGGFPVWLAPGAAPHGATPDCYSRAGREASAARLREGALLAGSMAGEAGREGIGALVTDD